MESDPISCTNPKSENIGVVGKQVMDAKTDTSLSIISHNLTLINTNTESLCGRMMKNVNHESLAEHRSFSRWSERQNRSPVMAVTRKQEPARRSAGLFQKIHKEKIFMTKTERGNWLCNIQNSADAVFQSAHRLTSTVQIFLESCFAAKPSAAPKPSSQATSPFHSRRRRSPRSSAGTPAS